MWLNDLYHSIDPIALSVGPLSIRWYGLAYLFGFFATGVMIYRVARRWRLEVSADDVVTIMTAVACGVIIGARLGYVLFYGKGYYLAHPLAILMLNEGGMSFHGGLVGAIVGAYLANREVGFAPLTLIDLGSIGAPIGLFLGRCANFVNGELWGKETDLPWGVMFETGGQVYRHPSQLYEALLEGLIMFVLLWALARKVPARSQGTFMGTFLLWYGLCRILVEFVRVPDSQLGYLLGGVVTMGQILSLPLVVGGIALLIWSHKAAHPQVGHVA